MTDTELRTISVPEVIELNASRYPTHPALISGQTNLTWRELNRRGNQVAAGLIDDGMRVGDRVAILAENSAEYMEALIGTLKAGCCAVPLPLLVDGATIARMLSDSKARTLFASSSQSPLFDAAVSELRDNPIESMIGLDFDDDRFSGFDAWREKQADANVNRVDDLEQSYNIIYSSGTTGTPKGIVHSHGVRAGYAAVVENQGFGHNSVTLISTGLYSNWACMAMIIGFYSGGTIVAMPKFQVDAFFDVARSLEVTDAFLVPAQIVRLLDDQAFDAFAANSRTRVWTAGSPLALERKQELLNRWPGRINEIYGQTEGAPSTLLDMRQWPEKAASVGRPLGGGIIEVIDEDGNLLPARKKGELIGHGPIMIDSYFERPEATEKIKWHHPDGRLFFRSGDLGYVDEEGFVYVLDRKKDMILSGGLNVYAADIEEVLAQHPSVQECTVVAVPSDRWGESPLALVIPKQGASETEGDVREWLNARVGKAQRVCAVIFRKSFPRISLDKILKRELREEYEGLGYGNLGKF
jgi:acyl-CoA synthetase (AMP-forming)/AMP-acid ligase II